jgi:hypothetical protein
MMDQDVVVGSYETEVEHRLEPIGVFLHDFRGGRPSSVVVPLWNLRALHDESRLAGHKELAALCEWMEGKIVALQTGSLDDKESIVEEIERAGEHIRERAHCLVSGSEMNGAGCVKKTAEA